MLARVYLFYDGVYNDNKGGAMPGGLTKEQALQYCEEVIKSQRYSLEPEFKNLWPAACTEASTKTEGRKSTYVEDSNEIVWVVKFNNDQNWNNSNINGSAVGIVAETTNLFKECCKFLDISHKVTSCKYFLYYIMEYANCQFRTQA